MANFEEFSALADSGEHQNAKRSALAIFCRAPRFGSVKTRLAQTHGDAFALQLYRAMLADTFDLGRALSPNVETFACFTPPDAFDGSDSLLRLWNGPKLAQCDGDLGAKILNCFAQLRARGFEKVAIIGSDSPDLPLLQLRQSFEKLQNHDFTVGPSRDGGFYLIGASVEFSAAIFDDVVWSSDETLNRVESNLRRFPQKMKQKDFLHRLKSWRDVDEADDLTELKRRIFEVGTHAPHTREFLENHP